MTRSNPFLRIALAAISLSVLGAGESAASIWDFGIPSTVEEQKLARTYVYPYPRSRYLIGGADIGYRTFMPDGRPSTEWVMSPRLPGNKIEREWMNGILVRAQGSIRGIDGKTFQPHGPSFRWNESGALTEESYFIRGTEVSKNSYLGALRNDPTLPPADWFTNPEYAKPFEHTAAATPSNPSSPSSPATYFWQRTIPAGATETPLSSSGGFTMVEYQKDGRKAGLRLFFDEAGNRMAFQSVFDGPNHHGPFQSWHNNGQPKELMFYRNDKKTGPAFEWAESGALTKSAFWLDGAEVSESVYKDAVSRDNTLPPVDVQTRPEFGGLPAPTATPRLSEADQALVAKVQALLAEASRKFQQPVDYSSQPTLTPQNPKIESLRKVWEAAQVADRIADLETRVLMLLMAADRQIAFGGRVFAFTSKTDFINSAADILAKVPEPIRRIDDKPLRSTLYFQLATSWRDLTKIALWGSHSHNKMACDKETIHYYTLAVQEDPTNQVAKATLDQVTKPKPPVPSTPPEVEKLEAIPEERWNLAGEISSAMAENRLTDLLKSTPQTAFYFDGKAHLVDISGDVRINKNPCGAGEEHYLAYQDVVATGSDGKAWIEWEDGTRFHIKTNAEVTYCGSNLLIQRGGVFVGPVVKRGARFVITHTAATGIRGTAYEVEVAADGSTLIHTYEGVVEVRNGMSQTFVLPGKMTTAPVERGELATVEFEVERRMKIAWPHLPPMNDPWWSRPPGTRAVLEDDFGDGAVDATKWEHRSAKGGEGTGFFEGTGSRVFAPEGRIQIEMNAVGDGGALVSRPFPIQQGKLLKIEKRTRVHASQPHFLGLTSILAEDTKHAYAMTHYMDWDGMKGIHAGLAPKEGPQLPPIWDAWFDETMVYDPQSGWIHLTVNGKSVAAHGTPAPATGRMRVGFTAYGWGTGHRHDIDWIRVGWFAPQAGSAFRDEFNDNALDPTKWRVVSTQGGVQAGFFPEAGRTVGVDGGILKLTMAAGGKGGAVVSTPIPKEPGRLLRVEKRMRVHFADNHFLGRTSILGATDLDDQYAAFIYARWNERNAFVIDLPTGPDTMNPVWDRWFTEVLLYDPDTGRYSVTVDGAQALTSAGRPGDGPFRVGMHPYGWAAGQTVETDWIDVSWVEKDQLVAKPPAPKTIEIEEKWRIRFQTGVTVKQSNPITWEVFLDGEKVGYQQIDAAAKRVVFEEVSLASVPGIVVQREWYPDGRLKSGAVWHNQEHHGPMIGYAEDGTIEEEIYWARWKRITKEEYNEARKSDPTLPPADWFAACAKPADAGLGLTPPPASTAPPAATALAPLATPRSAKTPVPASAPTASPQPSLPPMIAPTPPPATSIPTQTADPAAPTATHAAPPPPPSPGNVLFEDNFDDGRYDTAFFQPCVVHGKGTGFREGKGSSVRIDNEALVLAQDATDNGGGAITSPIAPRPNKILVLSRRVRLHSANTYFTGRVAILSEDLQGQLAQAVYWNYKGNNGFRLSQADGPGFPAIWDRWFDEVIAFDPATGELSWSVDGAQAVVWKGAPVASPFRLGFSAYGWFTGHRHEMDDVILAWIDKPAIPTPTPVADNAASAATPTPDDASEDASNSSAAPTPRLLEPGPDPYALALSNLFEVLTRLTDQGAKTTDRPPIQMEFNLLHLAIGDAAPRLTTVPAIDFEQGPPLDTMEALYAVSEDDNFKFVFAPNESLYVYLFQIDATGEVAWQFPQSVVTDSTTTVCNVWPHAEGVNPVTRGTEPAQMPAGADAWLYLNEQGRDGVENFFLIASRTRQVELEEALGAVLAAASIEKEGAAPVFSETAIRRPLSITPDTAPAPVPDGSGGPIPARAIATEAGTLSYTPESVEHPGDPLILVRSFAHRAPK